MGFTFIGLEAQDWLDLGISLLIVAATLTLGRWVIRIFLDQIVRRITQRSDTKLDDVLIGALRWPLYGLSVVFATQIALARLDFTPTSWDAGLDDIFYVYFLCALWSGHFYFYLAGCGRFIFLVRPGNCLSDRNRS